MLLALSVIFIAGGLARDMSSCARAFLWSFVSASAMKMTDRANSIDYIASRTGADANVEAASVDNLIHQGKNMAKMLVAMAPSRTLVDSQMKVLQGEVKRTYSDLTDSTSLLEETSTSQAADTERDSKASSAEAEQAEFG